MNRWLRTAVILCGAVGLVGRWLPVAMAAVAPGGYLGPVDVVASPDQRFLYVVEADGGRIDVVDVAGGKVRRRIDLPTAPSGLTVRGDGRALYATCGGPRGRVCVVETATGRITATIPVGHTPCGPALLPSGARLFVCNRFNNDVSVIDVATGKPVARVQAVREPVAAAVTPDGARVLVANLLPAGPADADNVAAEVTVIHTGDLKTSTVRLPNGSSSVHGLCVAPDGTYAYVVHVLSRYQMPTTQLERGWMNTNAMSVIDVAAEKLLNTVLLDDIDRGAANPWSVATTADGKRIVVVHAGTHELSVINAAGLIKKLRGLPHATAASGPGYDANSQGPFPPVTAADVPNDLAFLIDLRRRIPLCSGAGSRVGRTPCRCAAGPRGLALVGSKAYIAAYFSDLLAVVDLGRKTGDSLRTIPLGPAPKLTLARRGAMFFHDADLCFQAWQSCSSCHPDGRVDGLNWDLMNDGLGNPKNARSMLLVARTPPAMSSGVRKTGAEAVRAGIRHIQFAVRPEKDAVAIDAYLRSLEPVPSPHLVDGTLSESARRGKKLFFSSRAGCATCHPAPLYTDLKMHHVASRGRYDRRADFDTPTLVEVWRTAPYLHDGHFATVKELLRKGRHGRVGGAFEELTKRELDDLAEFVLSL